MPKIFKNKVAWFKVESAYGSDSTPTGSANAVRASEVEIEPEIDELLRPEVGLTRSQLVGVGGKQRNTLNVKVEAKGSGTAGTAPKGLGDLLRSAGMEQTLVAVTSATYKPRDSGHESVSSYIHLDGLQHKALGFVSDMKWEFTAGELPYFSFEGKALWTDPTDVTFPTTHTPDTTKPKALKNMTVTIDSYAAVVRSFKGGLGNVIAERPDFNAAKGIAGFQIVDREPSCEFEIECVSLATKDYFARLTADAICAFSFPYNNGAGNIITMTGNFRIRGIKYGDGDGILTMTLDCQLCSDASHTPGSELSIALT